MASIEEYKKRLEAYAVYLEGMGDKDGSQKARDTAEKLSKDKIEELYATCAGNSIVSNISGNIYINHNPNQTFLSICI